MLLPDHTDDFLWFYQNLRAQEAAQAEAEDKEDLEIAVETGGRNTPMISAALSSIYTNLAVKRFVKAKPGNSSHSVLWALWEQCSEY